MKQSNDGKKDAQTEKFMKRAIELSRIHMLKGVGGPFGAVIVKDGKIVAEGWNQVTSTNDPTAHAEVTAIRAASKALKNFDLSGTELYTSCEPCPMCLSAAYWARIEKIYFAGTREDAAASQFDDDFIYTEIPKPITDRKIPMVKLLNAEARAVFKEWDDLASKTRY